MDIGKAMKNPASMFGTPEVVIAQGDLTAEQKRAILLQWKDQLQQLQTADDEGMQKNEEGARSSADLLTRVTSVLSQIDAELR
jgi:polysaccharide pyruvyl transferase WcaK-like protein